VDGSVKFRPLATYSWDENEKVVRLYISHQFPASAATPTTDRDVLVLPLGRRAVLLQIAAGASASGKASSQRDGVQLLLSPLKADIDPAGGHSVKVKPSGDCVITLRKHIHGKWNDLLDKDMYGKAISLGRSGPEGSAGNSIAGWMKQMYEEGDEEMRRAIGESYIQSRTNPMPSFE
jgi:hypothetical protein